MVIAQLYVEGVLGAGAMLAGLHPLGVIAAGTFVAGVLVGADSMSRAVGVPNAIADVIVAASLPVGANVFLFAQRYEVAQDEVTASVAVSTMLALVTMPVVILLTTRFVV